jgi:hypothetical protein
MHATSVDIKPINVLLFSENIEEMIRRDIFASPPRTHALERNSESAPSLLTESQPLTWMPPLDPTCTSDLNVHVKLADFGAGESLMDVISAHDVNFIQLIGLTSTPLM